MSRPCIVPTRSGSEAFHAKRKPCLRYLALPLTLIALTQRSPAQQPAGQPSPSFVQIAELPNAPTPQVSGPIIPALSNPDILAGTGEITGTITDPDGAAIAGARITLTPGDQAADPSPADDPAPIAVSTTNGRFTLPNIPPGPFLLSIAAIGFAPQQTTGELHPRESLELPKIALKPASTATNIEVTATQTEIAEAQLHLEEKQRVLGVLPNFYVSYIPNPVPLTPRQKFSLAFKDMIDPVNFVLTGVAAGGEQANHTYAWELGAQGYAKRYAAAYGTFLDGTLLGSAVLPVLLKQDPRYFYKGTGSVPSRIGYAAANAVVCKGDNHRWQPNYSAILGSLAASGISNLYYPAPNRSGAGVIFQGAAMGTAFTAAFNLIQEFASRKLTPHAPKDTSSTP